jgi:hypothetical protein
MDGENHILTIKTHILVRRDTAENWEKSGRLADGEMGYDTTNNVLKIGNFGSEDNTNSDIVDGGQAST